MKCDGIRDGAMPPTTLRRDWDPRLSSSRPQLARVAASSQDVTMPAYVNLPFIDALRDFVRVRCVERRARGACHSRRYHSHRQTRAQTLLAARQLCTFPTRARQTGSDPPRNTCALAEIFSFTGNRICRPSRTRITRRAIGPTVASLSPMRICKTSGTSPPARRGLRSFRKNESASGRLL